VALGPVGIEQRVAEAPAQACEPGGQALPGARASADLFCLYVHDTPRAFVDIATTQPASLRYRGDFASRPFLYRWYRGEQPQA
jgi:hypothetical protein